MTENWRKSELRWSKIDGEKPTREKGGGGGIRGRERRGAKGRERKECQRCEVEEGEEEGTAASREKRVLVWEDGVMVEGQVWKRNVGDEDENWDRGIIGGKGKSSPQGAEKGPWGATFIWVKNLWGAKDTRSRLEKKIISIRPSKKKTKKKEKKNLERKNLERKKNLKELQQWT